MKNNNNNSKRDIGFSFDYSDNSATDADQLLNEGTMARRNSLNGQEKTSDASTTLEVLNNIFKAFNTVTEKSSCQTADGASENHDKKESGNDSANPVNDNGTPESSVAVPSQDNSPIEAAEKTSADNIETGSPVKPEKEQEDKTDNKTHEVSKGSSDNNSGDLSAMVQKKLWFFPVFEGDEKRVEDIRRTKEIVSRFDCYEEMAKAINDYMEEGNDVDAEVFFLLHNAYTLEKPEKYYHFFRSNLFSKEPLSGGKGEEIDDILGKITKKKVRG